jgi:hypothetical protein
LVTAGASVLLVGCSGESDPQRAFAGGTYAKNLGITLVVDHAEVDSSGAKVHIALRNPSAHKVLLDPTRVKLVVDEVEYSNDGSADYIGVPVGVGSGGGESSGALVFPDAPADGTEYLLHLEADSENTTIGDEGRLTWDVRLQ